MQPGIFLRPEENVGWQANRARLLLRFADVRKQRKNSDYQSPLDRKKKGEESRDRKKIR